MGKPITNGRKSDGTFSKGNRFSPGRPKGSKHKLSEGFIQALVDDFEAHGGKTIQRMREDDPSGYIRVIASLMPKQIGIERPLDGLTDAELEEAIALLRAMSKEASMADPERGE
jgi:hypothetical protein